MFRLLIKALYFIPVPYIYGSKVKWIQPVIYGKGKYSINSLV